MEPLKNPVFLQRMLLLFWALYFSLVLASNLTDGLQAAGWLPAGLAFASGNFGMMMEVTAIYQTPAWLVAILFLGVLIWESLAMILFWRAFLRFRSDRTLTQAAFFLGILLAAAFVVMDELFMAYRVADLEKAHLLLFIALVMSLLVVRGASENQERIEKK